MDKKIIGTFSVLVLAMFVVGLNVGNVKDSVIDDGLDYGSNVCVYLNDELVECKENTVTTQGLNMVRDSLGAGGAVTLTNLTLGNASAPLAASTTLDGIWSTHGLAGATGAYNSNGNGNWSRAYTWTATGGGATVNTTAIYNSTSDKIFAGTSFTATTLQIDDQLKVNYTVYVT